MKILPTILNNAKVIEIEPIGDERGYFARRFCQKELAECGIDFNVAQANVAYNKDAYTLRGMHFQLPPYAEGKIISCPKGEIYDVIVDLNKDSSTYGKWFGITLTEENGLSLYVPKGFAHGYMTLTEDTMIHYYVSEFYTPSHESGVKFDDPTFQIDWPFKENLLISEKDKKWKAFNLELDGIYLEEK